MVSRPPSRAAFAQGGCCAGRGGHGRRSGKWRRPLGALRALSAEPVHQGEGQKLARARVDGLCDADALAHGRHEVELAQEAGGLHDQHL